MNPYDFVRVDWQKPGARRPATPQDRLSGICGRLEGTITTLTPFFIPGKGREEPRRFLRDGHNQCIIPGASLKGLFRSLVETVGGGAWWFFGRNGTWSDNVNYSANLPDQFQCPTDLHQLDAACRMFGFLDRRSLLAGSVGFEDAPCEAPTQHDPIYTCILSSPKPRHRTWYLDNAQQRVRGRKFYFHSTRLQTARSWLPGPDVPAQQRQNAYIHPVGPGSVFTFRCHFTNVAPDDFALLLYAIVLEPGIRHKMGYAKPAGLGSIAVTTQWLETVDYLARYRAGGGGIRRYTGEALATFLQTTLAPYTGDMTSPTLQDLRRIWQWPAVHGQRYPSQDWFRTNQTAPISSTP